MEEKFMGKSIFLTMLCIFLIQESYFSISWALDFDTDVPVPLKEQIQNDLQFIYSVRGTQQSPLHQEIFGKVDGDVYKNFFETRVFNVGVKDCGGKNAVACVIPYLTAHKMWMSPVYTQFSHPQIARLMVIFHEARHTENKEWNWSHAKCPIPYVDDNGHDIVSIWSGAKLAGEPACDATVYGSYGSSLIMLKNISRFCSNCSDKIKMDAELYGADQVSRLYTPTAKKSIQQDL